jgi:Tol biopolymer transport system component
MGSGEHVSQRGHRAWRAAFAAALVASLAAPSVAEATFPGANGQIAVEAFDQDGQDNDRETPDSSAISLIKPSGAGGLRTAGQGLHGSGPAFSADGRTLIYAHVPFGPPETSTPQYGIAAWRLGTASDPPSFVTDPASPDATSAREPAPAPDGERFLFTTGTGLWVTRFPTGSEYPPPRSVRSDFDGDCPTWSPAGGSIAYRSGRSILRLRPDGSELPPIYRDRAWLSSIGCPSWSPDGKLVAFADNPRDRILIVNRRGKLQRSLKVRVPQDAGYIGMLVAFSPDGKKIAYADSTLGINVIGLRDGRRRRIFPGDYPGLSYWDIDWAPRLGRGE